ncbi:MAG: 16S rRNA (guanine(527)-N(7))-methyltransferase RsmG [Defluviitaleaceae bacterium]|nr:16S rRNA (guanine(527)-N(7))-methyltransferase RsmG [Defluviitaleaceae bacterium]
MPLTPLVNWCRTQGINITDAQLAQFETFKANLLDWNQRMNLTAITDDEGIWQKHFADSLTLLPFLPAPLLTKSPELPAAQPLRLIDIGSGAGFPGLPIKIMRPDMAMTMLDSLRKRVYFLEDTIGQLGLADITCIHSRAEDLAKHKDHSRQYDICTARAVARLDKLCKWCLPFAKPNGIFLAMKGPDVSEEMEAAMPTIRQFGAKVADVRRVEIVPGLVHSVVVIQG